MPHICFDDEKFRFPSVDTSDEEGLVLIGGRVTPERIIEAYKQGIFPWYNDEALPLWWSPDPRFVLFPDELHISRSMKKDLSKNSFDFSINKAFEQVIEHCSTVARRGQDGTWITPRMKEVYVALFHQGFAHSAEAWKDNELVGGIYGIQIGNVFFGESMFSKASNASKFAFIKLVTHLKAKNVALIDCQVYTEHVESLGARLIDRKSYLHLLQTYVYDITNH